MQRSLVFFNRSLFSRRVPARFCDLMLSTLPLACASGGCENALRNLTDPYEFGGLTHRGATVAHVHDRQQGYGSGRTLELYAHLKRLGVNSIQLNTFAYQPRNESTTLRWDDPTLTFEDLAKEIRTARAQGLRVLVKPHVWVGGWTGDAAELWRSKIRFADDAPADAWFASYAEFLLPQARIAEREGASAFVVGTELVGLTHPRHSRRWRDLIAQVRNVYSGDLSYACEAWNAKNITFWDALDAIGLDFYYGYPPPESPGLPPLEYVNVSAKPGQNPEQAAAPRLAPNGVADLAQFYRRKLDEHFAQARRLRRPLWLTEIGFPSHELAVRTPHAWPDPKLAVATELQAQGYRALLMAMRMNAANDADTTGAANAPGYPQGMWIWKYATALDSYEGRNYKRGFHVRRKPAEAVVREIFQSAD